MVVITEKDNATELSSDESQTKKQKLGSDNINDNCKNRNQFSNEVNDEAEDETNYVASRKLRYVNNKEDNEKSL